jgi:sulfofructose kinase
MRFPFELRSDAIYDAVGFGTNAVDHLIRIPQFPSFASKIELNDYSVAAGGEIASTMVGLNRLGHRTAYAGRLGSDREGEIGLQSLTDEGVGSEYVEIVQDARTQVAFILIDESSGERTILWSRDKKLAYSSDDAPVEAVRKARLLHMTPHDGAACIRMASEANYAGVPVSIDVDNIFDGLDELLPLVNICIASSEFPGKLTGISDRRGALRDIQERYGCAVTGMTLGTMGSLILCDGTIIQTNGYEVPGGCVDTTGAGDAFRSGFLHGILLGVEVEIAAEMANAVAALKCRRPGARAGLPDASELAEVLGASNT